MASELAAASILPRTLAHDHGFLQRVERVWGRGHDVRVRTARANPGAADERSAAARRRAAFAEAGAYFRYGLARTVLTTLIEQAASEGKPRDHRVNWPDDVERRLVERLSHPVRKDAKLEPGDRRRALRRDLLTALQMGSRRIAWRGEKRCVECGKRWLTRDYCEDHWRMTWLRARNENQMLTAINATAEALGLAGTSTPSRRRRATRTAAD